MTGCLNDIRKNKSLKRKLNYNFFLIFFVVLTVKMSQCAICFATSQSPFTTKCKHTFCNKCLLQWMLENDSCPMCRFSITEKDLTETADDLIEEIEEENDPMFTVYLGKNFNEEYSDILNLCVDDFIDTYRYPDLYYPIFRWKERKNGYYDVRVKQKDMYVTFRFEVFKNTSHSEKFIINVFTSFRYIKKFNEVTHFRKINKFNNKLLLGKQRNYRKCP